MVARRFRSDGNFAVAAAETAALRPPIRTIDRAVTEIGKLDLATPSIPLYIARSFDKIEHLCDVQRVLRPKSR